MKALPLVTLVLCLAFLGLQQASLSSRSKTVQTLESRIAEVKAAGPARGAGAGGTMADADGKSSRMKRRGVADGGPQSLGDLDLEELARTMTANRSGGMPNFKSMLQMQALLLEATPEELQDLIARTAELDVPDQIKQSLIGEFVGALAEHDPKAALEMAFSSEHLDIDQQEGRYRHVFAKWVAEDPRAAIAWFDREQDKGTFETRTLDREGRHRTNFESAAVAALLSSDPALARQRLLALPESERLAVLEQGHNFHITPENALAHANLVRETLPAENRARVLADASRDLLRQVGYDGLAAHTTRINANDEERGAIVRAAVERDFERFGWEGRTPTSEDVSEAHAFLQSQLPEAGNQATGEALARFGNINSNFQSASTLLLELNRTSPNDQLLVSFLDNSRRADASVRQAIAEQISDPARRQEALGDPK